MPKGITIFKWLTGYNMETSDANLTAEIAVEMSQGWGEAFSDLGQVVSDTVGDLWKDLTTSREQPQAVKEAIDRQRQYRELYRQSDRVEMGFESIRNNPPEATPIDLILDEDEFKIPENETTHERLLRTDPAG